MMMMIPYAPFFSIYKDNLLTNLLDADFKWLEMAALPRPNYTKL